MSIELTKQQLCEVVDGSCTECSDNPVFRGAEFDSRQISGGELFVALAGETTHGHQFIDNVFSRGASLALVEDGELLKSSEHKDSLILVSDTLEAWKTLGNWWRNQFHIPLLGITGSVGKTTIKEMSAAILLAHNLGAYSVKSYNNEVGLPYCLLKLSQEHNWVVQEMGMNAPGEMSVLTEIAQPDVAVISNIRRAHVESFANIDEIADAKLEILEGLSEKGILVIPSDDDVLHRRLEVSGFAGKVETFGNDSGSSAQVRDCSVTNEGSLKFLLVLDGQEQEITMQALGEHNALNAACAALATKRLVAELSLESIALGLRSFRAPSKRLELRRLSGGRVIVDDSYNANTASMKAAFGAVAAMRGEGQKLGLILGDMLELGDSAGDEHRQVGEAAMSISPDFIVGVGAHAELLVGSAKEANVPYFTVDSAVAAAQVARKLPFDLLLVKASRGTALDKTVSSLLEWEGEELPSQGIAFRMKDQKD